MRAYLAAGWFTPEQEESLEDMIKLCKEIGVPFYSPRDDFKYIPGETDPNNVFSSNVREIDGCSFVIASTEGKDMGTLWEAGYAYGKSIPVIYYWKNGEGKFNLMLAQSGVTVARTPEELRVILNMSLGQNMWYKKQQFKGEQE